MGGNRRSSFLRMSKPEPSTNAIEAQVRASMKKSFSILIDPRTSRRIGYWDALTSLALVWTALVTPSEVALLEAATKMSDPLFLINRGIDGIFIFDMFLQFFMMIEVKMPEADGGSVWVSNACTIAKSYLKGWFTLDLVSVLVSVFDCVNLPWFADLEA